MNHDITHCGNENCKDRERCYRYSAWQELYEKQMKGCYSLYFYDGSVDCKENCDLPWIDKEIYIMDEDGDFSFVPNKP